MTFQTEFPDFDPTTMPAIPAQWTDQSWHNDACPCFNTGAVLVYVDFTDPADREFGEACRRFCVQTNPEVTDCDDVLFETDDWNEVLAFVAEQVIDFSKMSAAQLNDWYEDKVGYRPQVDDPSMSDAELRELCESYSKAAAGVSE